MPKHLQVNVSCNSGSTGRIAEQIGSYCQHFGWDCYIAHGARYTNPTRLKSVMTSTIAEERIHALRSLLFDQQGLGSRRATLRLIQEIKKIQPDIIHLHNIHGYFLNYPLFFEYLKESQIPVVWTLHDCWNFTGHCAYFDQIKCAKWLSGCHDCQLLKDYPKSLFIDNSKSNWEQKKKAFTSLRNLTLVTVSDWLKGLSQQSFLSEYDVMTIYNGIDTDIFKPSNAPIVRKDPKLRDKKILLGVASTWSPRKGLSDFIELSKILDSKYQIVLIGLDEKQLRLLPSNILGIRRTENVQELVDYYSEADIVLNLSREESFGLTTVEGFACGTPSIVCNCTASPELIDENTGIIVEPGNLQQVKSAIEKLSKMPKDYYKSLCREQALNKFSNIKQLQKYKDLYFQILHETDRSKSI